MSGKIDHKKMWGKWWGKSVIDKQKKPFKSRLFPVDLDAPYMDLERIFILRVIKNIEI